MSSLLPDHDAETVRFYCVGCETTWRADPKCPLCGRKGAKGSTGNEPKGWPRLRVAPSSPWRRVT